MSVILTVEAKAKGTYKENAGEDVVVTAKTPHGGAARSWIDDGSGTIEQRLTEIVRAILVSAEERYRQERIEGYQHALRHRAWLEEDRLRSAAEAEKTRIALEERKARERVDSLLEQASDLYRAQTVRLYVETVLARSGMKHPPADFARWVAWARAEADRLDPVLNGAALRSHHRR